MTQTKSQQAQEYATQKTEQDVPESYGEMRLRRVAMLFDSYDIEQAFEDGYTAAEQSIWHSVEEELPEDDSYFYFVADVNKNPLAVDCAEYTCETKKFSRGSQILHPTHWMPIPSLPDTNTEKK